jgi:Fic family protein
LHISGTFKLDEKVNIEEQKANIEGSFTAKTASHVCRLLEEFGFRTIFGRSDVQIVLGLKPTRSTALMKELSEKGFIEPVTGLGKGKYRCKKSQG